MKVKKKCKNDQYKKRVPLQNVVSEETVVKSFQGKGMAKV